MLVEYIHPRTKMSFIQSHRVSSNSTIPDLETTPDNGNPPVPPPRTKPVIINRMSQQSELQLKQAKQHKPQYTNGLDLHPSVKKKEVCSIWDYSQNKIFHIYTFIFQPGSMTCCFLCSASLFPCILQSKVDD